jgi:hypothetical protein
VASSKLVAAAVYCVEKKEFGYIWIMASDLFLTGEGMQWRMPWRG